MTNTLNLNAVTDLTKKGREELSNVGCIKIGNKTYTVDRVNNNGEVRISRQTSCNPFARLANAIYDFFARGCSTTTRASQLTSIFNTTITQPQNTEVVQENSSIESTHAMDNKTRNKVIGRLDVFASLLGSQLDKITERINEIDQEITQLKQAEEGSSPAKVQDKAERLIELRRDADTLTRKMETISAYLDIIKNCSALDYNAIVKLAQEGATLLASNEGSTKIDAFVNDCLERVASTKNKPVLLEKKKDLINKELGALYVQQDKNGKSLTDLNEMIDRNGSNPDLSNTIKALEELTAAQHNVATTIEGKKAELRVCEQKLQHLQDSGLWSAQLKKEEEMLTQAQALKQDIDSASAALKTSLLDYNETNDSVMSKVASYNKTIEALTPRLNSYIKWQGLLYQFSDDAPYISEIAKAMCQQITKEVGECSRAFKEAQTKIIEKYCSDKTTTDVSKKAYDLCLLQFFTISALSQKEKDSEVRAELQLSQLLMKRATKFNDYVAEMLNKVLNDPKERGILGGVYVVIQKESFALRNLLKVDANYFNFIQKEHIAPALDKAYDDKAYDDKAYDSADTDQRAVALKNYVAAFHQQLDLNLQPKASLQESLNDLTRIQATTAPDKAMTELQLSVLRIENRMAAEANKRAAEALLQSTFISYIRKVAQDCASPDDNTENQSLISKIVEQGKKAVVTVANSVLDVNKTALSIYAENIEAAEKKEKLPTKEHYYDTATQHYLNEAVLYLKGSQAHLDSDDFKYSGYLEEMPATYMSEADIAKSYAKIEEHRTTLTGLIRDDGTAENKCLVLMDSIENTRNRIEESPENPNELGYLTPDAIKALNEMCDNWKTELDNEMKRLSPKARELTEDILQLKRKIDQNELKRRQLAERKMAQFIAEGQRLVDESNGKTRDRHDATTLSQSGHLKDQQRVKEALQNAADSQIKIKKMEERSKLSAQSMAVIEHVEAELDELLDITLSNLDKMLKRGVQLEKLEKKTEKMANEARQFHEAAKAVNDKYQPVPRVIRERVDRLFGS